MLTASHWLEVADRLAARLCRDALWDGKRCTWLSAEPGFAGPKGPPLWRAAGPDLYAGSTGIALFLGRMYARTGDNIYRQVADGALQHAREHPASTAPASRFSLYLGSVGLAWVLDTLAADLDRPAWSTVALQIAHTLQEVDPSGAPLDVISGLAGGILGLLGLQARTRQAFLADLAVRLGHEMLRRAHRRTIGWSWETLPGKQSQDLTGLGHGAAGIVAALLELYHVRGDPAFRVGALGGLRYERWWFDPVRGNWPDFRAALGSPLSTHRPSYGVAWCHGAVGIGLTRLRAVALGEDAACLRDVTAAVATTVRALDCQAARIRAPTSASATGQLAGLNSCSTRAGLWVTRCW